MRLPEKIKRLRKQKGISQQGLADKIGIHITHVSRLENGHYQPSLDVVRKMIAFFEVSADFLISDSETDFEVKSEDKAMVEKIKLINELELDEREALIKIIDAILTKKKVLDLLTNNKTSTF